MTNKTNGKYSFVQDGDNSNPIQRAKQDCFNHGMETARASGTIVPLNQDIEALKAYASTMARELYRSEFNPSLYLHDQLREAQYRKSLADLPEAELGLKHAAANLRECGQLVAKLGAGLKRREASKAGLIFAVAALAFTISVTTHDFFFVTIGDDFWRWSLSIVAGILLACWITWSMVVSISETGQRNPLNWVGLGSGILLCVGLAMLRISVDPLAAIAFGVIEFAVILGLESYAAALRRDLQAWFPRHVEYTKACSLRDEALSEVKRRQEEVLLANAGRQDYLAYVENRAERHVPLEELETILFNAALAGYNAGIQKNIGRLRGIPDSEGLT